MYISFLKNNEGKGPQRQEKLLKLPGPLSSAMKETHSNHHRVRTLEQLFPKCQLLSLFVSPFHR